MEVARHLWKAGHCSRRWGNARARRGLASIREEATKARDIPPVRAVEDLTETHREIIHQTVTDPRRIAIVRSYDELHAVLRSRADELAVTRETIDAVAGLPSGYAGKVLAPTPIRALGRISMGLVLGALGLVLIVAEDTDTLARLQSRLTKRRRPPRHASHGSNPASDPIALEQRANVVILNRHREWSRRANDARTLALSRDRRQRIARKAARSRWKRQRAARG
jgi:hypothetical protein